MKHRAAGFTKSALALSVSAAMGLTLCAPVQAVTFNWGDVEGSFDSTWTLGASWRTEKRDWDNLIGKSNQPQFDWTGYSAFNNPLYGSSEIWAQPGSYSTNGDLSNLLYSQGDTTSEVFKGVHELELVYNNFGVFARGMYFYDKKLNDAKFDYGNPVTGERFDPCADKQAKEVQCQDVRLLDAYVFADWDFNDGYNPVSVRLGRQVISWGESTLIPHGIGVINPVDLNILNQPGAELKEAFRPQGMFWTSIGITEKLSLEGFYQYEWEPIWVPAPGSFLSTNDFAGYGGYVNNAQLGFTANPDLTLNFIISEMEKIGAAALSGQVSAADLGNMMLAYSTKATLIQDQSKARNDGQYGLKLAYYAPQLADTEFGLYFMNYHSRRPLISGTVSDFRAEAISADIGALAANAGSIDRDVMLSLNTFSKAQIVYPEDIKLYGFSFNTNIGNTSVAGEIAHRQDEPLQIDDVELLFAAMPQQLANAGLRPDLDGISQMDVINPGEYAEGFIRRDTTQAQVTFTHLFGPTIGSDNFTFLAEVGGVWIHDMPGFDELRLNGPGTARSGGNPDMPGIIQALHNGPETNPFPTDSAWGYRLVGKMDFNNAFAGINVAPRVIWSHDVKGITPDPMFLFTEGTKKVSAGINFDFQSKWGFDVSYNGFMGGVGTTNQLKDRDYVSVSLKYSI
ncbi:DUF1302 domain-containing protein [Paraferrimonas sedimenticola]|uniref:DUF1302 domain-containing protein n=1 Tax=Paraferrimonas sedimenticola TaxID=375674 RepID=A0AA37W2S2_9GAMM|nr:DUF1302 domain-containing protein [Paraferrimonas sedimenticola]GLP98068.1 hypothetical protein GCM10007895_33750 [Paraferrimonas sedimenticola]